MDELHKLKLITLWAVSRDFCLQLFFIKFTASPGSIEVFF